jgi:N6-adenosine-specific RNA methylase IME4
MALRAVVARDRHGRAAANHYSTSPLDVIKARDVASIAADDSVLFLWATVPMLPQALEVMAAWGFEYRTQFAWAKDRAGTGYWNRNKHELLLVGAKGNIPAPAMGTQWESLVAGEVGSHSTKPGWQYELIEAYFPTLPRIELNARRYRPGWDSWGAEAPQPAVMMLPTSPDLVPAVPEQPTPTPPATPTPAGEPDLDDIPDFLDRRRKPAPAASRAARDDGATALEEAC